MKLLCLLWQIAKEINVAIFVTLLAIIKSPVNLFNQNNLKEKNPESIIHLDMYIFWRGIYLDEIVIII